MPDLAAISQNLSTLKARALNDVNPSGIIYQNALKASEAAGDTPALLAEVFDWQVNQTKPESLLSEEDKLTLATDITTLEEREKVIHARKLKKARKRLARLQKADKPVSRLTQPLRKTIAELAANDLDFAIDLIAGLAPAVPYFEPDQLMWLLENIESQEQQWKPPIDSLVIHSVIGEVFDVVQDSAVRVELIKTFYEKSRDGRWWDSFSGDSYGNVPLRYRENPGVNEENQDFDQPTDVTAANILQQLGMREVTYTRKVAEIAAKAKIDSASLSKVHEISRKVEAGTDSSLLLACLPVSLFYKPTSSMFAAAQNLQWFLEDGIDMSEAWKKARSWDELYPPPSSKSFEIPQKILELDGSFIRNVEFQIIRNGADLKFNATQMGNCTNGRLNGLKNGKSTMWRIYHDGKIYNGQTNSGNNRSREIQGSSKRDGSYNVPTNVRNAWKELIERMQ